MHKKSNLGPYNKHTTVKYTLFTDCVSIWGPRNQLFWDSKGIPSVYILCLSKTLTLCANMLSVSSS